MLTVRCRSRQFVLNSCYSGCARHTWPQSFPSPSDDTSQVECPCCIHFFCRVCVPEWTVYSTVTCPNKHPSTHKGPGPLRHPHQIAFIYSIWSQTAQLRNICMAKWHWQQVLAHEQYLDFYKSYDSLWRGTEWRGENRSCGEEVETAVDVL